MWISIFSEYEPVQTGRSWINCTLSSADVSVLPFPLMWSDVGIVMSLLPTIQRTLSGFIPLHIRHIEDILLWAHKSHKYPCSPLIPKEHLFLQWSCPYYSITHAENLSSLEALSPKRPLKVICSITLQEPTGYNKIEHYPKRPSAFKDYLVPDTSVVSALYLTNLQVKAWNKCLCLWEDFLGSHPLFIYPQYE